MPRFWHSSPKIAPTPEKVSSHIIQTFSFRQIQVALWIQDSGICRHLGTGLVSLTLCYMPCHCVIAATSTYPIRQGIDRSVICCWWIRFP
jgi:hypothetical protein